MRLNQLKNILLFVGALALVVGCVQLPSVQNIEDQPIAANKPSVTLDEIGKAIIRAGDSINMQMKQVRPGLISATYTARELSAVMEVKYDTKQYSITYKDSQNLKYDGTHIHSRYNQWVRNLDNRIRVQLSTL